MRRDPGKASGSRLKLQEKVLRVGELTRYLKRMIEGDQLLNSVSVFGEVTNLSRAASGHYYFTLKDDQSQLSCVFFRQAAGQQLEESSALRQGVNVIAEGVVGVYEPRGSYQLTVQRIRVQGEGAARLRFEKLRAMLEAEGLFAPERKRALPVHPKVLALVTSPESDAYHDVIRRLEHQWPWVKVILAATSVQGEHAAGQICLAIDVVNRMTDAEAILLVRGGGSPEELACFNDERVARAIFASRIPILTGIGHDQDFTIADFVADQRATTPTAAAAAAVPDAVALRSRCRQLQAQMVGITRRSLTTRRRNLLVTEQSLLRVSPAGRMRDRRQRIDELWTRMLRSTSSEIEIRRRRLDAIDRQMKALDPLAVLGRGYALLMDETSGRVVSSIDHAKPGLRIRARVKDGEFGVTVVGGK